MSNRQRMARGTAQPRADRWEAGETGAEISPYTKTLSYETQMHVPYLILWPTSQGNLARDS